jgi:hypothetical protein
MLSVVDFQLPFQLADIVKTFTLDSVDSFSGLLDLLRSALQLLLQVTLTFG